MKKILLALCIFAAANEIMAQSSFYDKYHEKYMGWGIFSTGASFGGEGDIPVAPMMGMSIVGRHGLGEWCKDVLAIGYEATVGGELNLNRIDNGEESGVIAPHYSVTLKIFPYKCWFLSAGYGTVGFATIKAFSKNDGTFSSDGWRHEKGYIFNLGYDFVGNLDDGHGIYFALKGGVNYDTSLEKMLPSVGFTLGVVWRLRGEK
jgi:hypothetical protein